jgi:hypothetical protein
LSSSAVHALVFGFSGAYLYSPHRLRSLYADLLKKVKAIVKQLVLFIGENVLDII